MNIFLKTLDESISMTPPSSISSRRAILFSLIGFCFILATVSMSYFSEFVPIAFLKRDNSSIDVIIEHLTSCTIDDRSRTQIFRRVSQETSHSVVAMRWYTIGLCTWSGLHFTWSRCWYCSFVINFVAANDRHVDWVIFLCGARTTSDQWCLVFMGQNH